MEFKDKVVIVTGGAQGIGYSIAQAFVNHGAKVIVIDKNKDFEDQHLDYYCGDLKEPTILQSFFEYVIHSYNKVDILVNNAMLHNQGILSGCSYDHFLDSLKVGLVAPYYLSLLFKNHFEKGSSIINIASSRHLMSQGDTESYSATKGGIVSLTHSLAVSLRGQVRVNSISPGWIDTTNSEFSKEDQQQHLVNRIGKPEDIVNMVHYLCSEKASFITGQDFVVDGGMSKQMIYHGDEGWTYQK